METTFKGETDTLHLRLAPGPVAECSEVSPGIMLEFDAQGKLVGIEIRNAQQTLADAAGPNPDKR